MNILRVLYMPIGWFLICAISIFGFLFFAIFLIGKIPEDEGVASALLILPLGIFLVGWVIVTFRVASWLIEKLPFARAEETSESFKVGC